jgi:hypothetical protein
VVMQIHVRIRSRSLISRSVNTIAFYHRSRYFL